MAVELEGGLNGIVPQALAHGLYVDAGFEEERGVRVPQAMQPECRHRGQIPHSASEAPTDNVRVLRRAPGPAED
ncbi:MAG TPA: hypothetical protein VNF26_02795 [Candidatus Baltobacterales bacterium]|nr:hypothetical protein [Candidatus Baltobacterales bacterium]